MSEAATRPPRLTTFPAFDGFRGYGVMIVLFAHFPQVLDSEIYNIAWQINQASRFGYIALDVFFAISGFFITRLLLRERHLTGRISFREFYRRRALRIFPVYYLTVLVCFFLFHFNSGETLSLLTYTFNFYHPIVPTPNPLEHTWSLSVEEQFYFFWPLLILLVPPRLLSLITGRVVPVLAVCCGLVISIATLHADNMMSGNLVYMSIFTRMLSLSLGGWIAVREFENRPFRGWPCLLLFVTAVVLLAFNLTGKRVGIVSSQGFYWTIALIAYAMISVSIVCTVVFDRGLVHRCLNAVLCVPVARGIGQISYALYVYHLPVLFLMGLNDAAINGGKAPIAKVALALAITMALGIASYFVIERPLQKMRHRGGIKPEGLAPGQRGASVAVLASGETAIK